MAQPLPGYSLATLSRRVWLVAMAPNGHSKSRNCILVAACALEPRLPRGKLDHMLPANYCSVLFWAFSPSFQLCGGGYCACCSLSAEPEAADSPQPSLANSLQQDQQEAAELLPQSSMPALSIRCCCCCCCRTSLQSLRLPTGSCKLRCTAFSRTSRRSRSCCQTTELNRQHTAACRQHTKHCRFVHLLARPLKVKCAGLRKGQYHKLGTDS
jgi:hypothetical protein